MMKKILINNKDITVVLQGSTLGEFNGKRCIEYSIASIKKMLPDCKIILSTWENETIPDKLLKLVDIAIFNKDPGFKTRNGKSDGKPNNVNRQIVSTINGLREVKTKYALKMRTDFVIENLGFIKNFDKYQKFDKNFQIFEKRVMCVMPGTRKPKAIRFNLPFHIADHTTFGLTSDLIKLYDIDLVTDDEFEWFLNHTEFMPDTFARNKYNAEQSIWINCLKRNGIDVKCEYSTHVNDEIIEQSEKYMVNNFYPLPFKKYGLKALKKQFWSKNAILGYCDFYTNYEWKKLYKKYCDKNFKLEDFDFERYLINISIKIQSGSYLKIIKKINRFVIGKFF